MCNKSLEPHTKTHIKSLVRFAILDFLSAYVKYQRRAAPDRTFVLRFFELAKCRCWDCVFSKIKCLFSVLNENGWVVVRSGRKYIGWRRRIWREFGGLCVCAGANMVLWWWIVVRWCFVEFRFTSIAFNRDCRSKSYLSPSNRYIRCQNVWQIVCSSAVYRQM